MEKSPPAISTLLLDSQTAAAAETLPGSVGINRFKQENLASFTSCGSAPQWKAESYASLDRVQPQRDFHQRSRKEFDHVKYPCAGSVGRLSKYCVNITAKTLFTHSQTPEGERDHQSQKISHYGLKNAIFSACPPTQWKSHGTCLP